MKSEEFEALIQKEFMEGALRRFSPYIAHRREYKGHYYPGYEIGVSTKSCRFLFVWESPHKSMPRDEQITYALHATGKSFSPYANQISLMFSSEDTMSEWILDHENYEDEQFRLKW